MATLPVVNVTGELTWGPDVLVIPEHAFGVRCVAPDLQLSDEHTEYGWFDFEDAMERLRWDSNRNALWELDHRLRHYGLMRSEQASRSASDLRPTRILATTYGGRGDWLDESKRGMLGSVNPTATFAARPT